VWPFGRKAKYDKANSPKTEGPHAVVDADGSLTVTTTVAMSGEPRPINDDVVTAFDRALERLGGEVVHAFDPVKRILGFAHGGPAVWSVGIVSVPGKTPYTLLMTYGLSHALSPEAARKDVTHEYSLAVPAGAPASPWADALLRHLGKYTLTRQPLAIGDVLPCYAPITWLPFPREQHASLPQTSLVGVITTADPVLPRIATAHGEVEVRRLLGIDEDELDRAQTWSPRGFVEEYAKRDPLLLTDLARPSAMADADFCARVDGRAEEEGSELPVILLDVAWQDTGTELVIEFPGGREAQKLLDGLAGRLPFGNSLEVVSRRSPPLTFRPAEAFAIAGSPKGLIIDGHLDDANLAAILAYADPNAGGGTVRIARKG
jgi:hypothetical protein